MNDLVTGGGVYSEPYFPIVVFSIEDSEPQSKVHKWWSSTCFPMKTRIESHESHKEAILGNRREIGAYIPSSDSIVIDKELFLHYVLLGCHLNSALVRIIKRLIPDMPLHKQLEFRALVNLDSWKVKDSSELLEKHDSVIKAVYGSKKKYKKITQE